MPRHERAMWSRYVGLGSFRAALRRHHPHLSVPLTSSAGLLIDLVCLGAPIIMTEAGDIGLMTDLMKDLENPEIMKEVEKLMKVSAREHE